MYHSSKACLDGARTTDARQKVGAFGGSQDLCGVNLALFLVGAHLAPWPPELSVACHPIKSFAN